MGPPPPLPAAAARRRRGGRAILGLAAWLSLAACRGGAGPGAPAAAPTAEAEVGADGRLPDGVQPVGYELSLHLDPAAADFAGTVKITLKLAQPTRRIWLHAQDLEVQGVTFYPLAGGKLGGTLQQVRADGLARLDAEATLPAGMVSVIVAYRGALGTQLDGLYRVEADGAPYLFSQFEAVSARRALPCLDEPRFKAPFTVTLVVPRPLTAVSNAPLLGEQVADDDVGHKVLAFQPTPPLPTYLLAFAVGPFDVVAGNTLMPHARRDEPVPLRGLAPRGRGGQLGHALGQAEALVQALELYFGIGYPFAKLDLIAVPDFAAGAMENAAAITFRDWLLLLPPHPSAAQRRDATYVLAHELTHQWFGDWVTMPWWDDLWLNEAFATWLGYRVAAAVVPEQGYAQDFVAGVHSAMRTDALPAARRVRQPIDGVGAIFNAFDGITYMKGGGVLAMLERYVGPPAMQAGIAAYLREHRFASADAATFFAAVSAAAGTDVAPVLHSFLDQAGLPEVAAEVRCAAAGGGGTVTLRQRHYVELAGAGAGVADGRLWDIPVCWEAGGPDGAVAVRRCDRLAAAEQAVALPHCPTWVRLNPGAAGYYRQRPGPEMLAALAQAPPDTLTAMGTADSLVAAVAAASAPLPQLLAALEGLAARPERAVANVPLPLWRWLWHEVLPPAQRPQLGQRLRQLYGPAQRRLGLEGRADEGAQAALWRPELAALLADLGGDAGLQAALAARGRAFLGLPEGPLDAASLPPWAAAAAGAPPAAPPPPLRPEAVGADLVDRAIAQAGNALGLPVVQAAWAQLAAGPDAASRRQLLAGLAGIRRPEAAAAVLPLALAPQLRANEVFAVLGPALADSDRREAAWAFFAAHFDALAARLPEHQRARLPALAVGFCDEAAAARLQDFFAPRLAALPGAARPLAEACQSIRSCAARRAAHGPAARAHYAAAAP